MNYRADLQRKNRRTLLILAGVTVGMFGFGFALVPLYGFLCQVTGLQSVQQRSAIGEQAPSSAPAPSRIDRERWVTVKFDGTVHPDLPWAFEAEKRMVRVHPGEAMVVNFTARNRSSRTVTGQAIPSVAPTVAAPYFSKTECFCFTEQRLDGGESRDMPVRFVVRADLPPEVTTVTLSYTFFRSDGRA